MNRYPIGGYSDLRLMHPCASVPHLRQNQLSLRVWPDYTAIVETCCRAWNALMAIPERIASLTRRDWARAVGN